MDKPRNCGSCRHFHNKVHTWCVRFPPQVVDNRTAYYPTVLWDQTCGEWEQREEITP
jgi:hypothetical protein